MNNYYERAPGYGQPRYDFAYPTSRRQNGAHPVQFGFRHSTQFGIRHNTHVRSNNTFTNTTLTNSNHLYNTHNKNIINNTYKHNTHNKINTTNKDFAKVTKALFRKVQLEHHILIWNKLPKKIEKHLTESFKMITPPNPNVLLEIDLEKIYRDTHLAIREAVQKHLERSNTDTEEVLKKLDKTNGDDAAVIVERQLNRFGKKMDKKFIKHNLLKGLEVLGNINSSTEVITTGNINNTTEVMNTPTLGPNLINILLPNLALTNKTEIDTIHQPNIVPPTINTQPVNQTLKHNKPLTPTTSQIVNVQTPKRKDREEDVHAPKRKDTKETPPRIIKRKKKAQQVFKAMKFLPSQ